MICYLLVVLTPTLVVALSSMRAMLDDRAAWLELMIPTGRRFQLLLNSLSLACIVSIGAMALGWMGAVLLWRWHSRFATSLVWLVLPLIALPPYIHALVWLALSAWINHLAQGTGLFVVAPYGWAGTVWVELATFAPLALGCSWIGLRVIDPELVEAGRVTQTDLRCLVRIIFPLSTPALLTGGGIIFLLSFLDYSVPSLLQVNVYPMEVFAEFSASQSPERAFLLAVPLIAIAAAALIGLLEPLRNLTLRSVLFRAPWSSPPRWPAWLVVLQGAACFLLGVIALLPVLTLVLFSGDLAQLLTGLYQSSADIQFSFWTAALAVLISVPLAWSTARVLVSAHRASRLWWFLALAPLAMPAPLVGISLIAISNLSFLVGNVLITALLPSLANVARFAPLAALILLAQLRRMDPLLFDASLVFQPSWWRRKLLVAVPLLAPGIMSAAGIVFAFSLGELGATLMVTPPGLATLTLRIYNYLHYGATTIVAVLCFVLMAAVLMAGMTVAGGVILWLRLFSRSRNVA